MGDTRYAQSTAQSLAVPIMARFAVTQRTAGGARGRDEPVIADADYARDSARYNEILIPKCSEWLDVPKCDGSISSKTEPNWVAAAKLAAETQSSAVGKRIVDDLLFERGMVSEVTEIAAASTNREVWKHCVDRLTALYACAVCDVIVRTPPCDDLPGIVMNLSERDSFPMAELSNRGLEERAEYASSAWLGYQERIAAIACSSDKEPAFGAIDLLLGIVGRGALYDLANANGVRKEVGHYARSLAVCTGTLRSSGA